MMGSRTERWRKEKHCARERGKKGQTGGYSEKGWVREQERITEKMGTRKRTEGQQEQKKGQRSGQRRKKKQQGKRKRGRRGGGQERERKIRTGGRIEVAKKAWGGQQDGEGAKKNRGRGQDRRI